MYYGIIKKQGSGYLKKERKIILQYSTILTKLSSSEVCSYLN